ncbi:hypothetical protein KA977_03405, partial [Candidatus Dependentiae bacterium]|nr:hypothetical protein [Candidatus Dependentiae bacterium]
MRKYFSIIFLIFVILNNPLFSERRILQKPADYKITVNDDTDLGIFNTKVKYDRRAGLYYIYFSDEEGLQKKIWIEPAHLVDIIVEAKINKINDNEFEFEYSVLNKKSSSLELEGFSIEYRYDIYNIKTPINYNWSSMKYNKNAWKDNFPTDKEIYGWGNCDENNPFTKRGFTSTGFGYRTKGLPGIVKCFADGKKTDDPNTSNEKFSEFLYSIVPYFFDDMVSGRTVGAVERFDTLDSGINRLIDYTNIAFEEGWIEEEITVKKFINEYKEM